MRHLMLVFLWSALSAMAFACAVLAAAPFGGPF
jgi:hypothetical protein